MQNPRNEKIISLLNRRQQDLTVFMDEVHKPHNLAAIIRTCDAVGVSEVHAVFPKDGRLKAHEKKMENTAMGSCRWVTTHRHEDLESGLNQIKIENKQIFAAHFSDRAVDFREIDYTKPSCILVGSELHGVTEQAAEMADEHILIPMLGMVESLNVSVATAIILYEAQRQREAKKMYETRQLEDAHCESLRFSWLHPQVKSFCDKNKIRYPLINENGDIDDEEWRHERQMLTTKE
ncbi:MAG: tRNA (guanosine-2'-O-)-methyltransferase [Polaribacter sp.]|jgi:tRNA (guanosine-2'-O-)-methyltransferase